MDAIEAILGRRSIRSYTDKPVAKETVQQLLEAAMAAPSAGNQQPWHFVVVDDRALLEKITTVHPYAQMAKSAQLGILVCGDLSLEMHQGYWVQDCAAATENLLVAAHALGLGAVWTGVHPRSEREGLQGRPWHPQRRHAAFVRRHRLPRRGKAARRPLQSRPGVPQRLGEVGRVS
jgi:nitroreductase